MMEIVFALAPALLSAALCLVVNADALMALLKDVFKGVRIDHALVDVLADMAVDLSTYGSVGFGFLLQNLFGKHLTAGWTVAITVGWALLMLKVAVSLKRAAAELRAEEDEESGS